MQQLPEVLHHRPSCLFLGHRFSVPGEVIPSFAVRKPHNMRAPRAIESGSHELALRHLNLLTGSTLSASER